MSKTSAELVKKLRADPAPFQAVRTALHIIGDKWSALILLQLFDGPCRFTNVEASLPGLSPRTLSQRLRDLEEFGLITRQEYKEFPPRIEYSLTSKARDLQPVLHELKLWARKHCL